MPRLVFAALAFASVLARAEEAKPSASCNRLISDFQRSFKQHYDAHEYEAAVHTAYLLLKENGCLDSQPPNRVVGILNDFMVAAHHMDRDDVCVYLLDTDPVPAWVAKVTDAKVLDARDFNRGLCGGSCEGHRPSCVKGTAARAKQQAKAAH